MSGADAVPFHSAPIPMTRAIERLALAMAIIGGLVLCVLVLLIGVSVLGRGLDTFAHSAWAERTVPALAAAILDTGVGPVRGDFELVEAGVAFAIFAFLPICQLRGGHASVDVFTDRLPVRAQRSLVAFWELVLSAVIVLIAWRLFAGLLGKRASGETTFLLQFPLWWAYGASFAAASVAVVVALHCALARVLGVAANRDRPRGAKTSPDETLGEADRRTFTRAGFGADTDRGADADTDADTDAGGTKPLR